MMKERILGLDIVRSFAILFVLLAHGFVFLYPHIPSLKYLRHLGTAGVELFFVLSGYLIGGILLNYRKDLEKFGNVLHFMIRRWFRTLPNYYLFLIINILVFLLLQGNICDVLSLIPRYLTFTQNIYFRQSGFFPESWSLAIEEWFYFVMPVGIFLILKLTKNYRSSFLAVAIILLLFPFSLRLLEAGHRVSWDNEIRKIVFFRLDALMYGILAAYLHRRNPRFWNSIRYPCLIFGIAIVSFTYMSMCGIVLNDSFYSKTFLFNLFSIGFIMLMPWASQVRSTGWRSLDQGFRYTSLWSYSMYLWNFLLFKLVLMRFENNCRNDFPLSILIFFGYLIITYSLSAIVYYSFENPMMNFRDKVAPRK